MVKQSIIDDIVGVLTSLKDINLITKKELRSLLGKLNHAAGLLIVMRPFLDPLWAAWGSPSPKGKPNMVWIARIQTELAWFRSFFLGKGVSIERFFSLSAFHRTGTVVEIGTDASPWGLGGWLSVDGAITACFASQLTAHDSEKFGIPLADAKGQQVWEALAILVAVVLWSQAWQQDRIILKVKADNVTALTLLVKMRPSPSTAHARQLALISRELALHLVDLSFPPDAAHIPGVGHIFADALSRVFAPTGKGKITPDLHPALVTARVDEAPARDKSFHRITNFDNPASQIPPAAEEV